ncbi:MAG: 3D domain-containing protein [Minicystis sp.]
MRIASRAAVLGVAALIIAACGPSSGQRWVNELPESKRGGAEGEWKTADPDAPRGQPAGAQSIGPQQDPISVQDIAGTPRAVVQDEAADLFRNTYYDFPRDLGGDKSATVYDATCAPIAQVSQKFHDQVCVQGSGRLVTGETVSFAKRDCACAAICPRTGQKICFERLDPQSFPHGRGAAGRPIKPLRTVAVDTTVIPLGTAIYIPELVGLPLPEGGTHDGCFYAEDRGLKVVGRHIDVFTGDPAMTAQWNRIVPSNRGVHVKIGDPRCVRR